MPDGVDEVALGGGHQAVGRDDVAEVFEDGLEGLARKLALDQLRAGFGPQQLTVVGGSEDGTVHVWDLESTEVVQQLSGHRDVVFEAKWSRDASVLATCSSDTTVRVWDFKEAGDEPPDAS